MPHASRADLSQAFCSYSGYPPMGPWLVRPQARSLTAVGGPDSAA